MTTPNDKTPARIDRAALDRIIHRATELQTGEREVGDNLTKEEVLALGQDVGIPAKYLQQAMLEHETTVTAAPDDSFLGRAVGPGEVSAQRVIQGDPADVLVALQSWMDRNELMVVQRQQQGWVSWEPLKGMQAAIRRGAASLDTSKPKFMLSRAELVVATVTALESGYSRVSLQATLRQTRREHLTGAGVTVTLGAGAAGAIGYLGLSVAVIPALLAVVPIGVTLLIGTTVLRGFRPIAERVQLGLERALDFLERGGVKPGHELPGRSPGLLDVLANEVRRVITSGGDHGRRAAEQLPSRKDKLP